MDSLCIILIIFVNLYFSEIEALFKNLTKYLMEVILLTKKKMVLCRKTYVAYVDVKLHF